jgi:hypothetical protein
LFRPDGLWCVRRFQKDEQRLPRHFGGPGYIWDEGETPMQKRGAARNPLLGVNVIQSVVSAKPELSILGDR